MRHTYLRKLDLNLLLVFDALMDERSVTRVAQRLLLTQAGVSHALMRLRRLLDDELFTRGKGKMQPTARAIALAAPVRDALAQLDTALGPEHFDASTSDQIVRMVATDYFATLVLPELSHRLETTAPSIELRVLLNGIGSAEAMLANDEVEFAAGNFKNRMNNLGQPEYSSSTLFYDRYVCVLRRDHPLLAQRMTTARYLSGKHILFSPTGDATAGVERYFRKLGIQRQLGVVLSHYLAAPGILQSSDMIMTVPKRLAEYYIRHYDASIIGLPMRLPSLPIQLVWNSRFNAHPAYCWFRSIVEDVCRTFTSSTVKPS